MKVINSHRRIINQSQDKVSKLLETVSTKNDKIWPYENWPAIRFENGLKVGSKGGHGMVRYTIIEYHPGTYIKFQFTKPNGFNGTHEFNINGIDEQKTEISHTIEMITAGNATLLWTIAIRWLHDALIEDAFDKVVSHFTAEQKKTAHSLWVRFLRYVLKSKKKANH